MVAADMQAGLDIIKRKGTVLKCHKDMSEMVTLSEIGMSTAILEAGFNLDSLQLRYQVPLIVRDHDWTAHRTITLTQPHLCAHPPSIT